MASGKLPIATNCEGCGVCCLHMGYPTFMQPTVDAEGNAVPGEKYWYSLPQDLKAQLLKHIDNIQPPAEGKLDGPCIWLDPATSLCRHHEFRPRVCRDFEIGSRGCQEWREYYRDRLT